MRATYYYHTDILLSHHFRPWYPHRERKRKEPNGGLGNESKSKVRLPMVGFRGNRIAVHAVFDDRTMGIDTIWTNYLFSTNATITNSNTTINKCTLYLAKSTIPNAGLGVFTSIPLQTGQSVGYGDPAIPIVDIDYHNDASSVAEDYHWLLDDYNWNARASGYFMEMEADKTSAHVSGLGAMPNCHMSLKNIIESENQYDTAGVTRTDPGIGAFTGYHSRKTSTTGSIRAGQELFVDYGTQWFLTREKYMGMVPFRESYTPATKFLDLFRNGHLQNLMLSDEMEEPMSDLWAIIINFPYKSRPLSALPKTSKVANLAMEIGIHEAELSQSIRTLEDLEVHGKCLDNIRPGISTIPSAGRGAFATRLIPKGQLVAPAPLLHIPDRHVLNMYGDMIDTVTGKERRNLSDFIGHQLLLNYCFGHESSTLLLCPYGSGTAFINHNSTSPNAKIIWSNDSMYHNSSWLSEPVHYFDNMWSPGVAFEYMALRDIHEGEEITVNYGLEWIHAWEAHVQDWVSRVGHEGFVQPHVLNADLTSPLKTFDEDDSIYGDSIEPFCYFSYASINEGNDEWNETELDTDDHKIDRIVDRTAFCADGKPDFYVYTVDLRVEPNNGKALTVYRVKNVRREAISFYYKRYRSDMYVKGVFRHEMMIPDEMFPDAWRNVDS